MSENMIRGFPTIAGDAKYDYHHLGNMPFVAPQRYGAKGDGATDDTAAIQACLDESNTIYFPNGTYMVSSAGLKLHSNMHIILDANATIQRIADDATGKPLFVANECENITVEGGKVYGDLLSHNNLSDTEYGCHGFNFVHCHNIVLDGVEVAYHMGDSVRVGNGTAPSKNTTIRNCVFHDSHRHGVAVCGVDGFLIENTEIYGIKWLDEVDFETGDAQYPNVNCRIVQCWFHDPDTQDYSTNTGVMNHDCEGLLIHESDLHNIATGRGAYFSNSNIGSVDIGKTATVVEFNGCTIRSLNAYNSNEKVSCVNCVFKSVDDTKPVNVLQMRSNTANSTCNVSFDNCTAISSIANPKPEYRSFYFDTQPKNLSISNCNFVIRNGEGLDLQAVENLVAQNNTIKVEPSEVNANPFPLKVNVAKVCRVSNNVIDAMELTATGANGFIFIGTEDIQFFNNIVLSLSALGGVYNGNAIRLTAGVKNATICCNTFAAYPLLFYKHSEETVVKAANNTLSGDLTT